MMIVGFCTSWLGFGFFLGVAGAGLWVASTSASCILDTQKPVDEKKGQINILVKSAGWATPLGWLLLIPHWISSCMDSRAAQNDEEELQQDRQSIGQPPSTDAYLNSSPDVLPLSPDSPQTGRPDPRIWTTGSNAVNSPATLDPLAPPTLSPLRIYFVDGGPNQNEDSQSRCQDSSTRDVNSNLLVSSSTSQLNYSVSASDQITDAGPDEPTPAINQNPIRIVILNSPKTEPLPEVATTREETRGYIAEYINDN